MKDLLQRTVTMMGAGASGEDIYHTLTKEEGLTDTQAYYTYIGAKMVYQYVATAPRPTHMRRH